TIDTRTPLPFGLDEVEVKPVDEDGLVNFYKRLELKQLVIGFRKKDTLFTVEDNSDFEYKVLKTEEELSSVLKENLSVHFEFSEFNYHKAELWGIGLSNGKKHYFVSKETLL